MRTVLENKPAGFEKYNLSFPTFGTLKTSDNGTELTYYITKPHDFDETKQYPVLMYGYSGPAHQVATNNWIKVCPLFANVLMKLSGETSLAQHARLDGLYCILCGWKRNEWKR